MLRSPTHLVGHGPTSTGNGTTTSSSNHHNHNNNNNNNHNHNHNNHKHGNATTITANGSASGGTTSPPSVSPRSAGTSSQNSHQTTTTRTSLFDSCHRKIRLIGGGPVAFLGGLVAKARRKERDGDQNSTDTKLYLEESVLERKLPDADLKALVDLPAGLDYNEWLASHTLALFEHVNLVYGTISEFCTTSGCPDMTGPGNRTYLWFDEKGKKTRVAAPQYIDYVMTFTQKTVSDESIFPTKYANEFPSSFESIARKILRLQFHVIAHLYASHFREIALLGLHTHLNLTFAHLTALHRRFTLIDEKETDVLRDLEVALRLTDDGSTSALQGSNSGGDCKTTGGGGGSNNSSESTGLMHTTMSTSAEDSSLIHHHHHHHHHHHQQQSCSGNGCGLIDGDASVQPICTQPEAMRGLNDQSDRIGGLLNSSDNVCPSGGLNSSHIGNLMNYNINNNNHNSTHPITTNNSLLQCNSNNSSSNSNNSHNTTTA